MATVKQQLFPGYVILPPTNGPQLKSSVGTNFPVDALAFDGTTEEQCFLPFRAVNYGSGNLTVRYRWYADSGTTGDNIFSAAVAAITPDTDTQDVETKAFGTLASNTDTHLGTTAQRVHTATVVVTSLDAIAADDTCWLRFLRDADAAGDTMNAIDVNVVEVFAEYSDV